MDSPTRKWNDDTEISLLVSEAYYYKYLFDPK